MRIWIQEVDKNGGTPDFTLEELSKIAIDIALVSDRNKVRVVMILPDEFNDLKHYWEE